MNPKINIFWFRRDLRLNDNAGLYHALISGLPVLPIFIFDKHILNSLPDKADRRVTFIYRELKNLNESLAKHNSSLQIIFDTPLNAFEKLFRDYSVHSIYTNRDYEPYAIQRDGEIRSLCSRLNVEFKDFKDQVIFERDEVIKENQTAYTVFTPYARKWKDQLSDKLIPEYNTSIYYQNFFSQHIPFPALEITGFKANYSYLTEPDLQRLTIFDYHKNRDLPYLDKTTHVSVHLRFGTLSIRKLVNLASELNEKYLNELIWREFFMQVLWHFPYVVHHPFHKKYERVKWKNNEKHFEKWCLGETGFSLVDAGMRQLNETGWMHNRVRMITANFLTKILLIDWRWGEAYFADKLVDFELSSNNGNWQWAAGTGCDAAPYFRIFNPEKQATQYDPESIYRSKWIPGYQQSNYLDPIVNYEQARKDALSAFKLALLP